jgi:Undecaprenyl-phosphate glucose phosphotransferase
MLKKHGQLFLASVIILDSIAIIFSWLAAFYIHFETSFGPSPRYIIPEINIYLYALIPVWIIFLFSIRLCALYEPLRGKPFTIEIYKIIKVTFLSVIILSASTFFYREGSFSRFVAAYFFIVVTFLMIFSHFLVRVILAEVRKRGFNLRHVLIVGSGELGQSLAERINQHPEFGLKIVGFLSSHPEKIGIEINGIKIIGLYNQIPKIIQLFGVDQLYIALPLNAQDRLEKVLNSLNEETVDVKVVPDLLRFMNLQTGVDELDGLPIINLAESPLYGWNVVLKRISDIIFSVILIVILSPLFIILAIIIKLESTGPIIFWQERMGLDGKLFEMLKFRSMKIDAEQITGPVWASKVDNRRTRLGTFLRKTSIDELPQLFNVLIGDMSLVGPRPERPVFVKEFKKSIPKYMLRLKMKAGLTGWAQVSGWRGNTSLDKRIEFDLYYIKNWSLLFDFKIILMTVWKGFVNPNAY